MLAFVNEHKTKGVGALGIIAGAVENFISTHPDVHLPARGFLLSLFGMLVFLIGLYNQLSRYLEKP